VLDRFPYARDALRPIDLNEAQVLYPVSSDVAARITETNRNEKQQKYDQKVVNRIKQMLYTTADDFESVKPPQNDEVEVIGYIYKRPSSKLQDGDNINNGKKKGRSSHEAVALD
jgi:hypothetical protein